MAMRMPPWPEPVEDGASLEGAMLVVNGKDWVGEILVEGLTMSQQAIEVEIGCAYLIVCPACGSGEI